MRYQGIPNVLRIDLRIVESPLIKGCPFCGEKRIRNLIAQNLTGEYRVEHFCNNFSILGKFCKTEQEAIEAWNRRVSNETV